MFESYESKYLKSNKISKCCFCLSGIFKENMILLGLKIPNLLLAIGVIVSVTMETQDGQCQSTASLSQCEVFCKQYNLPLHFSLKKKHCYCRNDVESSEPGYVIIWE